MLTDIKSLTREELERQFGVWQEPAYRAAQVLHWLYARRVTRWEAMDNLPKRLRQQLGLVGQLYAIEQRLRQQQAAPPLRAAVRAWQGRPLLARLGRALVVVRRRVLPQSLLGQAVDNILAREAALNRYVADGRVEMDNSGCENAIRLTAVGKKNRRFIGHPDAGQRSAVIYSVPGSCRRLGINPAEYLQDVLERLPTASTTDIAALTPSGWLQAKRQATRKHA